MALKWKEGRYNSTHAKAGEVAMGTVWGMTRGDGYVASCSALSIELKGFSSHADAQKALEAEVRNRLKAALAALEE